MHKSTPNIMEITTVVPYWRPARATVSGSGMGRFMYRHTTAAGSGIGRFMYRHMTGSGSGIGRFMYHRMTGSGSGIGRFMYRRMTGSGSGIGRFMYRHMTGSDPGLGDSCIAHLPTRTLKQPPPQPLPTLKAITETPILQHFRPSHSARTPRIRI
jgi:hypothetical protein